MKVNLLFCQSDADCLTKLHYRLLKEREFNLIDDLDTDVPAKLLKKRKAGPMSQLFDVKRPGTVAFESFSGYRWVQLSE
jgi:hypothetical protein